MTIRTALIALIALATGCAGSGLGAPCGRHTDCAIGLVCSALLTCALPPVEADGDAGVDVDAGATDDGNRIPPGPEAGYEDASIDAPIDAAIDAPIDAP